MKNIGLILLLVVALCGCKSRNSHVQKAVLDSAASNRESINMDVQVNSRKVQLTGVVSDSNWNNVLQLKNFKGIIHTDGRLEGEAEAAVINQSGTKYQEENTKTESEDSMNNQSQGDIESSTKVKKGNTVAVKETKGIEVPWYIWLLGLGALALLVYAIYNRIKSKLNPF